MPYMPACSLRVHCQVRASVAGGLMREVLCRLCTAQAGGSLAHPPGRTRSKPTQLQSCFASGKYCAPSALVGTVCAADMPRVRAAGGRGQGWAGRLLPCLQSAG